MDFFRPQLAEWKEHDEVRLSLAIKHSEGFGWGSVTGLGIIHSLDNRPLLAYALAGGTNMNVASYQLQAETLNETFTFMVNEHTYAEVYYRNYPIGRITRDFFAYDLQGNIVMRCTPVNMNPLGDAAGPVSSVLPAPFQFASGKHGWYNIPLTNQNDYDLRAVEQCRAMGVLGKEPLHDYERRWLIAMWIFLFVGPWSTPAVREDMWGSFDPVPDNIFDLLLDH